MYNSSVSIYIYVYVVTLYNKRDLQEIPLRINNTGMIFTCPENKAQPCKPSNLYRRWKFYAL